MRGYGDRHHSRLFLRLSCRWWSAPRRAPPCSLGHRISIEAMTVGGNHVCPPRLHSLFAVPPFAGVYCATLRFKAAIRSITGGGTRSSMPGPVSCRSRAPSPSAQTQLTRLAIAICGTLSCPKDDQNTAAEKDDVHQGYPLPHECRELIGQL